MKTLVVIFALLLGTIFQNSDYYHIIKIKGKIFNVTTNKLVMPGETIKASDQLEFSSEDALALVISDEKGKFTLRMPEKDMFGDEEMLASADASISPVESRSQLSMRAFGQAGINDLNEYFGEDYFNIIGEKLIVSLDKAQYEMDDNNYFTFDFISGNNEKSVRIKHDGQKIIINKQDIVQEVTGKLKDTINDVAVYKYDLNAKLLVNVSNVNLAFIDKQELKKEFKAIIDILKNKDMDVKAINKYLATYFLDVYGNTDIVALNDFIYAITEAQ